MSTSQSSPHRGHHSLVVVVCLALATVVAAMASLNVALPDIARSTRASQTDLAWIIDAYSLMFAALLLPAGALGDRFGRRRALLVGLSIFGAGSAVAMTTDSAGELIALRGVLGIGASLVMPATLSTITSTLPGAKRAKAVSIWAGVAGAAAVLGLLATGAILHFLSWEWVFGLNVVLAGVSIAGTVRYVPESADPDAAKLDLVGAGLAFLALVVLVFTVIEAPDTGWLAARTLGGFAAAILLIAAFVGWELRQPEPMLDPRLFRHRRLSAGSGSILAQFFAFYGFVFIALQYLQIVRGDAPILAAVSVLPMAATMILSSRLAPRLIPRFGARWLCATGLLMITAAMVILSHLTTTSSYWLFAAGLWLLGCGMGLAMTPATSNITDSLPAAQQGVGSALNDLSREFGGALGIAVVGSILDAVYRTNLTVPGAPPTLLHRAQTSLGLAQSVGGRIAADAHTAFIAGLHTALLCAGGATLAAAVGVWFALTPRHARQPAGCDSDQPVSARSTQRARNATSIG
ncbi:MAG: MFS transporter [Solirubrobacterales bacterium]|nr:MFS transporter [Solirubrobacterales bacterium]MBV9942903.1 MFS transporter [Solirubrobacterales bacterium]